MEIVIAIFAALGTFWMVTKLVAKPNAPTDATLVAKTYQNQIDSQAKIDPAQILSVWDQMESSAVGERVILWKKDISWKKDGRAGYRFIFCHERILIVLSLQGDSAYMSKSLPKLEDFKVDRIALDKDLNSEVKRTFISVTSGTGEASGSFDGENESSGIGLSLGGGVSANFSRGSFSGDTFTSSKSRSVGEEILLEARLVLSPGSSVMRHEFKIRASVGDIVDMAYGDEWLLMSSTLVRYKKFFKEHLENCDNELDDTDSIEEDAEIFDQIARQLKLEAAKI